MVNEITIHDMKINAKQLLNKLEKAVTEDNEESGKHVRGLIWARKIVEEMQVDAYMEYLDEHN